MYAGVLISIYNYRCVDSRHDTNRKTDFLSLFLLFFVTKPCASCMPGLPQPVCDRASFHFPGVTSAAGCCCAGCCWLLAGAFPPQHPLPPPPYKLAIFCTRVPGSYRSVRLFTHGEIQIVCGLVWCCVCFVCMQSNLLLLYTSYP